MKTSLLRLLLILLLSLCLHLALLLVPAGNPARIADGGVPAQAPLKVRLLPAEEQARDTKLSAPQSIDTPRDDALSAPAPATTASPGTTAPALPVPMPDARDYYPSQLLGEKPRILEDPLYEMAHKLPTEATGKLVLRLHINEEGTMDAAIVEKSDVKADFVPQLQRAAMGMRFAPGRIDGQAVKTEMRIEVEIDNLRQWP